MSKSAARSRAKARRAASLSQNSYKTDANVDNACRHCGIHMNRRGLSTHEKHCDENPINKKRPAKKDRQSKETKKNKKTVKMPSTNSDTNIINSNKEHDFSKQYHPGAEYLSHSKRVP